MKHIEMTADEARAYDSDDQRKADREMSALRKRVQEMANERNDSVEVSHPDGFVAFVVDPSS